MTVQSESPEKRGAALPFEEDTHTRAIRLTVALILLSTQVYRGHGLTLSNVQTKAALDVSSRTLNRRQRDQPQVEWSFAPCLILVRHGLPQKTGAPHPPTAKST